MKNIGTIVAAVVLAVVLLAYMCTFQVRFTETAIKKTWGQPRQEGITEPGLYFKWPRPIQSVVVYDKRARLLEDRTEETRTIDGKNLLVTTFTLWRIKDPYKFHTNFPVGVEDGERKLRTTIITHKHAVVGKHEFKDFVSTVAADRKIRDIEQELKTVVARDANEQYGVEIVDFGIKKLGLPSSVTTTIFDSMKSYEEQKAKRYIAEGEARAADIVANAKAVEERILAEARKKAAEIQTNAQRVVSEYYKEFSDYPELRIFLDKLRTIRDALQQRTTLILTAEQPPWDIFDPSVRERIPLMGGAQKPAGQLEVQDGPAAPSKSE